MRRHAWRHLRVVEDLQPLALLKREICSRPGFVVVQRYKRGDASCEREGGLVKTTGSGGGASADQYQWDTGAIRKLCWTGVKSHLLGKCLNKCFLLMITPSEHTHTHPTISLKHCCPCQYSMSPRVLRPITIPQSYLIRVPGIIVEFAPPRRCSTNILLSLRYLCSEHRSFTCVPSPTTSCRSPAVTCSVDP